MSREEMKFAPMGWRTDEDWRPQSSDPICEYCRTDGFSFFGEKCSLPSHRRYAELRVVMRKCLPNLGSGSFREAFKSKNGRYVYKVPRNKKGYRDNVEEAAYYRRYQEMIAKDPDVKIYPVPARCRLAPSGILVMEFVTKASVSDMPPWAETIDAMQVGKSRDGRFVSWDFANSI